MNLSRPSRVIAAIVALLSMLFMQLAVAAYACPALSQASMQMDLPAASMEHCKGMDAQAPALCHAHDQAGNQSIDKSEPPQIQAFAANGLVLPVAPVVYPTVSSHSLIGTYNLARTTAPPISIRNCCFRI